MWNGIMQIIDWFGEIRDRYQLIRDFNRASKNAFIAGSFPILLEARITRGDSSYRHTFSKFLAGGFRIKALSGRTLKRSEVVEIGKTVLSNEELVRKLVALGWDTLEIHDSIGINGLKWPLKDFVNIKGVLDY